MQENPTESDPTGELEALTFFLVAASYLAFVALGLLAFRPRPFLGGGAAVLSICFGRALQWTIASKAATGAGASPSKRGSTR